MVLFSLSLTCVFLHLLCQSQVTDANTVFEVECYDQTDCSTPGWTCHNYVCRPPSCGPCEERNRKGKCKSICLSGQQCVKNQCVTVKQNSYDCQENTDCAPGYVCVYYKCVRKDNNICDKCSIYNGKYCELACTKGGEYCNPEVGCVCEYGLIRNSSGLCSPKNPEEYKPDKIPVAPKHKIPEYPRGTHKHPHEYPEPSKHTKQQYPEPNADQYPNEPPTIDYPPQSLTKDVQYPPPEQTQYPEPTVQYPEPTVQYPVPTEQYPNPTTTQDPYQDQQAECLYDYHCTPGYKCIESQCIPECTRDDHCFPGKRCIQYRCECGEDSHCGDGFYCNRKDYRCYESKAKPEPSPPKKQKPKPIKQCPVCEALDKSGQCVYQCDYHGYEVCDDVETKQCICRPGYTRYDNGKCVRERSKPTRPRKRRPSNKRPRKTTKQRRPKRPERKQRPRNNNKINWKKNIKMVWKQTSEGKSSKRGFVGSNQFSPDGIWTIPELKI